MGSPICVLLFGCRGRGMNHNSAGFWPSRVFVKRKGLRPEVWVQAFGFDLDLNHWHTPGDPEYVWRSLSRDAFTILLARLCSPGSESILVNAPVLERRFFRICSVGKIKSSW